MLRRNDDVTKCYVQPSIAEQLLYANTMKFKLLGNRRKQYICL